MLLKLFLGVVGFLLIYDVLYRIRVRRACRRAWEVVEWAFPPEEKEYYDAVIGSFREDQLPPLSIDKLAEVCYLAGRKYEATKKILQEGRSEGEEGDGDEEQEKWQFQS